MTKMKKCCAKKGYICDLSGEPIVRGDGYYKIIISDGKIDNKQMFNVFRIKASVYNTLDEQKQRYLYLYINDKKAIHHFFNDKAQKKAFQPYVKEKTEEKIAHCQKFVDFYQNTISKLKKILQQINSGR